MSAGSKLRHRWNHQSPIHRTLVRTANSILARLPTGLLYRGMLVRRQQILPYELVRPDDDVIQVGAPADTLKSGRARGMSFALLTPKGQTTIVEPSQRSIDFYRDVGDSMSVEGMRLEHAALFSEAQPSIRLYEDHDHPARNFVETVKDMINYSDEELADFEVTEVPAKTLDQVWRESCNGRRVRLVSITTNGSEEAILKGGVEVLSNTDYLALAITSDEVTELALNAGFELVGNDDRGFTYKRRDAT